MSGLYPTTAGALIGICRSVAPADNPTLSDGRLSGSSTSKEKLSANLLVSAKCNPMLAMIPDSKLLTAIKRILQDIPSAWQEFYANSSNEHVYFDIFTALNVGSVIVGKSQASIIEKAEEKADFNRDYHEAMKSIVNSRKKHLEEQSKIAAAAAKERQGQEATSLEAQHAFLQKAIGEEASVSCHCYPSSLHLTFFHSPGGGNKRKEEEKDPEQ